MAHVKIGYMNKFSFREVFLEQSKIAEREYKKVVSSFVDHNQQKGEAREYVLRNFLKKFLPERFGVGSGFVVDSKDGVSGQVDIVIYDKNVTIPLSIDGKRLFPIEGVVAVGEVKTNIADKGTLSDAIKQIMSVKKLNKTGSSSIGYTHDNGNFDKNNHRSIVFGFVFGGRLLEEKSMVKILRNHYRDDSREEWLDLVGSFESGLYSFLEKDVRKLEEIKSKTNGKELGEVLDSKIKNNYPTKDGYSLTATGFYHKALDREGESLMSFFMILYNNIIGREIGNYNLRDYIKEFSTSKLERFYFDD